MVAKRRQAAAKRHRSGPSGALTCIESSSRGELPRQGTRERIKKARLAGEGKAGRMAGLFCEEREEARPSAQVRAYWRGLGASPMNTPKSAATEPAVVMMAWVSASLTMPKAKNGAHSAAHVLGSRSLFPNPNRFTITSLVGPNVWPFSRKTAVQPGKV